jgi:hypothetical protein
MRRQCVNGGAGGDKPPTRLKPEQVLTNFFSQLKSSYTEVNDFEAFNPIAYTAPFFYIDY